MYFLLRTVGVLSKISYNLLSNSYRYEGVTILFCAWATDEKPIFPYSLCQKYSCIILLVQSQIRAKASALKVFSRKAKIFDVHQPSLGFRRGFVGRTRWRTYPKLHFCSPLLLFYENSAVSNSHKISRMKINISIMISIEFCSVTRSFIIQYSTPISRHVKYINKRIKQIIFSIVLGHERSINISK